jgi:uncharacterized protein YndB with AHSA1/START domain
MADIRHLITIGAPPATVYPLIGTVAGLTRWWAADVTGSPDGTVELGFFNRSTIYRLRLERHDAPIRVDWRCETGKEWSGTRIRFTLEPHEKGSLLRFIHSDWWAETEYYFACNTTWGHLLFRLKAVAEGKKPGPLFTAAGLAY